MGRRLEITGIQYNPLMPKVRFSGRVVTDKGTAADAPAVWTFQTGNTQVRAQWAKLAADPKTKALIFTALEQLRAKFTGCGTNPIQISQGRQVVLQGTVTSNGEDILLDRATVMFTKRGNDKSEACDSAQVKILNPLGEETFALYLSIDDGVEAFLRAGLLVFKDKAEKPAAPVVAQRRRVVVGKNNAVAFAK